MERFRVYPSHPQSFQFTVECMQGFWCLTSPPPLGHNYLAGKCQLQLTIHSSDILTRPLLDADGTQRSCKLVIQTLHGISRSPLTIPFSVVLPSQEPTQCFCYDLPSVEEMMESEVLFELFPAYGSLLVGKTAVKAERLLSETCAYAPVARHALKQRFIGNPLNTILLYDSANAITGKITIDTLLVTPYWHNMMDIRSVGTYWKSTQVCFSAL